jgi:CheY-like chemotaxis protein
LPTVTAQPIRLPARLVESWLDRLEPTDATPERVDSRNTPRFGFRGSNVVLEFKREPDEVTRYRAVGRNLSRGGISVLLGHFVYPRSACELTLTGPYGHTENVPGRTIRCRYLVGSGSLYEIGIQFDRGVDVGIFAPRAQRVRVLVLDDTESSRRLVQHLLRGEEVDLRFAASPKQVVAIARKSVVDLIMVDLESAQFDGLGLVRRLRLNGHIGPIVGLAVQTGQELREACAAAGCTGYLPRPITAQSLRGLVQALRDEPIVSDFATDPTMVPLINDFMKRLRQRVDELSLALQFNDLETMRRIAIEFRAEAGSYGFPPITEAAAYVQALAAAATDQDEVRRAAHRLLHLCLRARPAARPAPTPLRPVQAPGGYMQVLPSYLRPDGSHRNPFL